MQKMHSAWELFTGEGPLPFLRELIHKFVKLETYLAFRLDLSGKVIEGTGELPLIVRRATHEDFDRFKDLPSPFPRHAEFHEKFGLDQCYLGLIGAEIAHIAWIYYPNEAGRHPTPFRRLRPDEVAIANCVTLAGFRGKGVYPTVLRQLLGKVRSEGYRYCYMYIDVENEPSQRGVKKVGFVPVGRSWRARCFFHRDPASGFYLRGRCSEENPK